MKKTAQPKRPLNSGTRYTTEAKRQHVASGPNSKFNHDQKINSRNSYTENMGTSTKGHMLVRRGYSK